MSITEKLGQLLDSDQILVQEPMKNHTSFKVGGPADYFLRPKIEQIAPLLAFGQEEGIPVTVIGNGSNLLVGDKGIRGLVIEIGPKANAVSVSFPEEGSGGFVVAQAGASLAKAAVAASKAGLKGMEPLSGIPGSVGGAVVMNAGAYGGEMQDVLLEATILYQDGKTKVLPTNVLDLSYRHSNIPEAEGIVLSATFALEEGDREDIRAKMEILKEQREEKQPLEYPSAGSTFKRPVGEFAGKLITEAGLSGYAIGGAKVSEKHRGFLINYDGATAMDIRRLIEHVQSEVEKKSGIKLETEVRMIGEF